ncbi:hypothetical protein J2S18_000091 [Eubacterium multiforme]|uniref:Uncharacterized protein n=1 Tax=Eubacterium multiforme TaxID=83339 RepID=A0ABT9URF7_9FIRM|nr:hypothetical protein [Eubacterium multiforme]
MIINKIFKYKKNVNKINEILNNDNITDKNIRKKYLDRVKSIKDL